MAKEYTADRAQFVKALDSFAAVLSRVGKDVDQWRQDVTEAAHALNSATIKLARDGVPIEWVEFGAFRELFNGYIRLVYLDGGGQGMLAPLPTPLPFLRKLRTFANIFAGKKMIRPAIIMRAEDELILATLADAYPAAVNQPELSGLTSLPRQLIGERLEWLESKRLVKRPEGTERKGRAITPAGLSAIGRSVESPH